MRSLALCLVLAAASVSFAQTNSSNVTGTPTTTVQGMGGWAAGSVYNQLYNTSTEITFNGRVTGVVTSQSPAQAMEPATTILVQSPNGGTSTVDLGPTWYLTDMGSPVKVNDQLQVTGSKVFLNNRSFIIARKIVRNNKALYLRETNGFPMWIATRGHVDVGRTLKTDGTVTHEQTDLITNRNLPNPDQTQVAQSNQPPVQTINGTVQQVITMPNAQTGSQDTVMLVNTPNGVVSVDLGPQWYLQRQGVNFNAGGNVVVQASPVTPVPTSPTPIYVANGLTYGNQVMVFRNSYGAPLWAPWH